MGSGERGGIRLSQLGRRREVEFEYDGERVIIGFRPAGINDVWLERLGELAPDDRLGYAQLLSEVLVDWNIVGDDGGELKPSVEILRSLPADFVSQIAVAVMESLSPRPTRSET